ncbi:hypothetical protein K7X08_037236 [Anisodus acutangulus]|uniref:Uncharacterized protein n=1 Tax=Anisodus acutangulus TaxID=402998 RepID=A0A9Q1L724_9SOLA|nr:hypothetical protein K7X08_037236 [Anisodus acutangulus]
MSHNVKLVTDPNIGASGGPRWDKLKLGIPTTDNTKTKKTQPTDQTKAGDEVTMMVVNDMLKAKAKEKKEINKVQDILTPSMKMKYSVAIGVGIGRVSTLEWDDSAVKGLKGIQLDAWDYENKKEDIVSYMLTSLETLTSKFFHAARSITFICGALLRLVIKEEDNIVRAWNAICDQYRNFYQEDIYYNIIPSRQCLRAIRTVFQNRTILKNTIAAFLLAYNNLEGQDQGICKMLYELHMSYTGIHAYSLLLYCADKLKVPIHIFVAALDNHATRDALSAAINILVTYEFPQTPQNKEKASKAGAMLEYFIRRCLQSCRQKVVQH